MLIIVLRHPPPSSVILLTYNSPKILMPSTQLSNVQYQQGTPNPNLLGHRSVVSPGDTSMDNLAKVAPPPLGTITRACFGSLERVHE